MQALEKTRKELSCLGDEPQSSGEVHTTPLDKFVLRQLSEQDKRTAKEHVRRLTACISYQDARGIREWIAKRVATEDAISQVLAGHRTAVMAQNDLSAPMIRAAKEYDALVNSSHNRLMDWLEALRVLESSNRAHVRIGRVEQVAFIDSNGGR